MLGVDAQHFIVKVGVKLAAALDGLPVEHWPSGANFILFRPAAPKRGQDVWEGLLARGVLVRNCSSWPRLAGCLRVTVGTPAENDACSTASTLMSDSGPPVEPCVPK